MSVPPALRLDDIRFAFAGEEMRFDLEVPAGEWLAVIGPSGAGKSTLLDIVAGFLPPSSGRVLIGGEDMAGVGPGERPVSFVFQENNLFAQLSAFANVALGVSPKLALTPAQETAVRAALREVGLEGLEGRRPGDMSGGERQRVALARAFLRERPLILLDEPFAALGPALRREMLALLARLRNRDPARPKTILMVTHHPEDAQGHANRVAFLEGGRITALGPTQDILSAKGDAGVAAYLGIGPQ